MMHRMAARTVLEQEDSIKQFEDTAAGLVDGAHDRGALASDLPEQLYTAHGALRIQARGRFVEKDKARLRDELHAHGGTLALERRQAGDRVNSPDGC